MWAFDVWRARGGGVARRGRRAGRAGVRARARGEAVRAVVESLNACLQLGVDDLGAVKHFRVAILDSFGGLRVPPASLRPPGYSPSNSSSFSCIEEAIEASYHLQSR